VLVCGSRHRKIGLLIVAFTASFSSGKNNGVLTLNVMRHARSRGSFGSAFGGIN
jgi:hypothetical protein